MNNSQFSKCFSLLVVFSLTLGSFVPMAFSETLGSSGSSRGTGAAADLYEQPGETSLVTPISPEQLKNLDAVMRKNSGAQSAADSNRLLPLDDSSIRAQGEPRVVAMQLGAGGNPDVDGGKPFREKAWVISILYPVKTTRIGNVPTTIYAERRCQILGKQPESAHTDNNNVRCGPGVVADSKVASWLSFYARLGLVTSRFSKNGAPVGQMNAKTGKQFRDYANDTWFTGAAMGYGVKINVLKDTQVFAEYTKFYVQQTDNKAYQFRGGFNAGIAKRFWLFQGPRK